MPQRKKRLRPLVVCMSILIGLGALIGGGTKAFALTLEVIDTFAEVHSGPGRGYPIFYVIEQGETIDVLTRRPDWYEIKAKNGRVGWVKAAQIARTLQTTGEPVDLPSVSYGDYLKNSWRVGFTVGAFNGGDLDGADLDGADVFTANLGVRPFTWLSVDLEYGSFYDSDGEGDLYNANVLIEPFSKWRASPVLILGTGKLSLESAARLSDRNSTDPFLLYGIGVHYYVGRRFVVRGEYRTYRVSIEAENQNTDENLGSWRIGFNTFF